ncbi:hypothetical protein F2P81_008538 [Scophthalmus maximus]|uniref:Uncharacterized protein n=1 Tax=Scophthalmus maximus TaxID=52904 RepID=A0A6A4T2K9_SCOMX|nr:hypothetical protein F2P81_008538 [Scophthalmus maximus]
MLCGIRAGLLGKGDVRRSTYLPFSLSLTFRNLPLPDRSRRGPGPHLQPTWGLCSLYPARIVVSTRPVASPPGRDPVNTDSITDPRGSIVQMGK